MNTEIKLQYQTSTGRWINCEERTEEFLTRCEQTTDKSRDEIIAILKTGETVRNDSDDWYSYCRDGNTADRIAAEFKANKIAARDYPEGKKLDCGCVVFFKEHIMGANFGSSCCDCYDRMSDEY
jgi:hypothetical protein